MFIFIHNTYLTFKNVKQMLEERNTHNDALQCYNGLIIYKWQKISTKKNSENKHFSSQKSWTVLLWSAYYTAYFVR
jgi:hypothetical protein